MIKKQIIIFDKSSIILNGLSAIIEKTTDNCEILTCKTTEELFLLLKDQSISLMLANIDFFEKKIQKKFEELVSQKKIVFIQLSGDTKKSNNLEKKIISLFDNEEVIQDKILSALGKSNLQQTKKQTEIISSREESILREIALGLSNKEIADKLFISQHTVITHRKNITRKLGIKSVSGLTIYAILNKLISIEEVN